MWLPPKNLIFSPPSCITMAEWAAAHDVSDRRIVMRWPEPRPRVDLLATYGQIVTLLMGKLNDITQVHILTIVRRIAKSVTDFNRRYWKNQLVSLPPPIIPPVWTATTDGREGVRTFFSQSAGTAMHPVQTYRPDFGPRSEYIGVPFAFNPNPSPQFKFFIRSIRFGTVVLSTRVGETFRTWT